MTTEVDRLLVRIETTQRSFERQLKSMNTSSARSSRRYERDFRDANKRIISSFRPVGAAMTAIVGGLGTRQVIRYADAWTEAENKIAAASQITGVQARSVSELNDLADDTRAGLSETVDLYSRLLKATTAYAQSEHEVALATEIVNKSFKAGGATMAEQASGIRQLGQALGSSFLRGDELTTIMESAPLLAAAIAEEFNTTIGGLKQLGAEGKLTSERVYRAILGGQAEIEAAFSKTDATIGDGFTRVRNALTEYIATGDDSIHATEKLVSALTFMAENLDVVATGAVLLAVRGVTPLAVTMAARLAPAATTAALSLQLIATRGGAALVATSALRSSMALLGGPIGIAALAATGLVLALSNTKTAAERLREATADLDTDFTDVHEISATLKNDYRELEKANRDLEQAHKDGGAAAVEAAVLEVDAVNRRIVANQQALQEVEITRHAELNAARDAVAAAQAVMDAKTDEIRVQRELAENTAAAAAWYEAGMYDVYIANIERKIAAEKLSEEQIRAVQDSYRDMLLQQVQNGQQLTAEQQELLNLSGALREAEAKVEEMTAALEATGDAGNTAASGLDNAASSAEALGNRAAAATDAMATLISMVPQLNDAARTAGKMAEARAAYNTAINNAVNQDQAAEAARVFALATAEIDGSAEAARDAGEAVSGYLDQSHLNSLDARSRAIELEKRKFAELTAGIGNTVDAEQQLADLRAAHASNLAGIESSFADTGGGGGGGGGESQEPEASGNDTIDQLKFEIELIGKTSSEIAALTYRYQALKEAKQAGIDVDQVQIGSNQSLRESIDAEAAAIARLTLEAEQYREQADFMANATQSLKDGLIDAILEGKNFGSVLSDLGKQIAKAALQAALFGQGPLAALFGTAPGAGGGSLLGGLIPGFEVGGYTGPGGKYQPAGIVHKGEYVFDQEATSRIGVGKLEAMRRNLNGYADGGLVGPAPSIAARGAGFSPKINVEPAKLEVFVLDPTDARFDQLMQTARFEEGVARANERTRG